MLPGVIVSFNGALGVGKTSTARVPTEATLRARIVGRPEDECPHDWCLRHMPTAIVALQEGD